MSQQGIERRRWPRISASSLGLSAAIVAGPAVRLLNVSRGGGLLEVTARFPLRSSLQFKLTGSNGETIVADARVAWAKVASIVDGKINYRVAVVFDPLLPERIVATAGVPEHEQQGAASPSDTLVMPHASPSSQAAGPEHTPPVAERPQGIDGVRDNLTQFPSAASRHREHAAPSDASQEFAERRASNADSRAEDLRTQLAAASADLARQGTANQLLLARLTEADELRVALRSEAAAERSRLEGELAAAAADLARLSTINQSLAAKLSESDDLCAALRRELEMNSRAWEEERSTLARHAAEAVTKADALQAALDTREQEESLRRAEQARYEALIAELVKTTNDQQAEYQQLLEHITAAQDEQRCRATRQEAELACERTAAQQERAEWAVLRSQLEARLQAAEALCAAHEVRSQKLRLETEKLMSMFTSPVRSEFSQPDEAAVRHETGTDEAAAVA